MVVPPKNPYQGYDERQAELGTKDHPWAQPGGETEQPEPATATAEARADFVAYAAQEFRLTGPDNRSDEQRDQQRITNAAGRRLVTEAIAAAKAEQNNP